MSPRQRIEQALHRIAAGSGDALAVARIQASGEPSGWRDEMTYDRQGQQSYYTTRHGADAAGAPIGIWSAPADQARAQRLAQALFNARIWNMENAAEIMPGMELVSWTVVAGGGVLDLTFGSGSPLMMDLIHADVEMTALAGDLQEHRHGAALRVVIEAQTMANTVSFRVALINDGNRPCIVINPLRMRQDGPEGLVIELATIPRETPGVTSLGPVFAPASRSLVSRSMASPELARSDWEGDYIVLDPGKALPVPGVPSIGPLAPGHYLVRASYAYHGRLDTLAGVPVMRGKTFSNEAELTI